MKYSYNQTTQCSLRIKHMGNKNQASVKGLQIERDPETQRWVVWTCCPALCRLPLGLSTPSHAPSPELTRCTLSIRTTLPCPASLLRV